MRELFGRHPRIQLRELVERGLTGAITSNQIAAYDCTRPANASPAVNVDAMPLGDRAVDLVENPPHLRGCWIVEVTDCTPRVGDALSARCSFCLKDRLVGLERVAGRSEIDEVIDSGVEQQAKLCRNGRGRVSTGILSGQERSLDDPIGVRQRGFQRNTA